MLINVVAFEIYFYNDLRGELMRYREYIKRLFHKDIINTMNQSFSQEGEDIIVKLYIEENGINKDGKGIYVDLGAHHPYKYSNTAALYLMGWHGINIDADSECIKTFNKYRKRDKNVNAGVAEKAGVLDYYCFNDSALNTFDKSLIEFNEKIGFKLIDVKKISVVNINDLLEQHLSDGDRIDVFDIDIEGFDEKIIAAFDWEKYNPTIVLTERDMLTDKSEFVPNEILSGFGYKVYASTNRTVIYTKN